MGRRWRDWWRIFEEWRGASQSKTDGFGWVRPDVEFENNEKHVNDEICWNENLFNTSVFAIFSFAIVWRRFDSIR